MFFRTSFHRAVIRLHRHIHTTADLPMPRLHRLRTRCTTIRWYIHQTACLPVGRVTDTRRRRRCTRPTGICRWLACHLRSRRARLCRFTGDRRTVTGWTLVAARRYIITAQRACSIPASIALVSYLNVRLWFVILFRIANSREWQDSHWQSQLQINIRCVIIDVSSSITLVLRVCVCVCVTTRQLLRRLNKVLAWDGDFRCMVDKQVLIRFRIRLERKPLELLDEFFKRHGLILMISVQS